jgi:hypothetical protein
MPQTLVHNADDWAEANETSRSEDVRRLIELGLKERK